MTLLHKGTVVYCVINVVSLLILFYFCPGDETSLQQLLNLCRKTNWPVAKLRQELVKQVYVYSERR